MIKEISIIEKTYNIYLNCKPKENGNFSLKDFFNFYQNKNIRVFTKFNGIAIFSLIRDECELYFLGIEDNKRNLGYGKKLLKKVVTDCKVLGVKKIFLEVNETNKFAIKLYIHFGFAEIGKRKDYYKRELNSFGDAILMQLKLQP